MSTEKTITPKDLIHDFLQIDELDVFIEHLHEMFVSYVLSLNGDDPGDVADQTSCYVCLRDFIKKIKQYQIQINEKEI